MTPLLFAFILTPKKMTPLSILGAKGWVKTSKNDFGSKGVG